jgi:CRP/FNR family transcriptional regulator, cyclic AMP receptor protein
LERAEIEASLASCGWLGGSNAAFRRAVFERARPVVHRMDEFVFHAGDLAGGIYGIARGSYAIFVATAVAAPTVATIVRSGTWFGNGPLVAGRRRMLSFRATEPSVTLHLPLAAIRELSASSIQAACAFADLASMNMDLAVRAVSDLLIPHADRRIAATLLRLTRADERECPDHPLGFRLRQAELAAMANASRRSVVRALSAFEAHGWVAMNHARITVSDAAGLAEFAHG